MDEIKKLEAKLKVKPLISDLKDKTEDFLSWHKRVRQPPYDLDTVSLPVLDQLEALLLENRQEEGCSCKGPSSTK